MRHDFSKVLDQIPPSGIRKFFDLVLGQKDIISLGIGEPDFTTPWAVRRTGIDILEEGITSYTSNQGIDELRTAISHYHANRFGMHYDPKKEIMISVGVSEGMDIVLRAILNPGDEVIIPEPCYVCYQPLTQLAGGKVVSIDTSKTNFLPDPNVIRQAITPKTKAILLNTPNNPTGRVIPLDVLEEIGKIAVEHDLWVISDEIYAELTYDMDFPSFPSIKGMKERTILLSGFSKAFAMTGWRLGYVCAPNEVISRALKIHQYNMLCAPIFSQYAAVTAITQCLDEVQKMVESYHQRRNLIVGRLNEIGLPTEGAEGAFYCFPDITSTGLSDEEFAIRLLETEKVAVVPGSAFGKTGIGHVRCCYATDVQQIQLALKKIERFVESLKKK